MPHQKHASMTPEQFRDWRRRLGLKQKEAADQLGLKKRVIQYYEKGTRDGKKVEVPKTVRLACYALTAGVEDYDGEALPGPDTASAARSNGASGEAPNTTPGTAQDTDSSTKDRYPGE
jgi:transcriptional regulator with XRE-family HTH domain